MLGSRQLLLLISGDAVPITSRTTTPSVGPSVWWLSRYDKHLRRFTCAPLHKTPAESFIAGVDLSGAVGAMTVISAAVSYQAGHGLVFDAVAEWLQGVQGVSFGLSGGRVNTRHVLIVTAQTEDGETIKIDCPLEVVR